MKLIFIVILSLFPVISQGQEVKGSKQLKERVDVAAGKTRNAVIGLPSTSFEFYNRASRKMEIAAGEYEVLYGNSSDAKDLKMTKITIQ